MASRKAATTSWAQTIANQIVKDRERISVTLEHRVGLEPTLPLKRQYESGVLAARRPVLCFSSGTRGTRTLTPPVKSRDFLIKGAAANTSVPNCLQVGVEGIEPSAHDL